MKFPRFAELLSRQLQGIVDLSPAQMAPLHAHFEFLLRWNQRMNLTSIRQPEEMITRHYCESIFFAASLRDVPHGASIVDLGSGAGFPGIPMAALRPDWRITLLESHRRKAVFLRESTRGWPNVSVTAQRAGDVAARFDHLVSRAVSLPDVLREIPRLSSRVGLLLAEGDLPELRTRPGIQWSEPVNVPWARRRICIFGQCCA